MLAKPPLLLFLVLSLASAVRMKRLLCVTTMLIRDLLTDMFMPCHHFICRFIRLVTLQASIFALLLWPLLTSLFARTFFNRNLPRTAFSLPPRQPTVKSAFTRLARSIAIALAGVELITLILAAWQELLLWAHLGSATVQVGQGVRMGIALVLRPVAWSTVAVCLALRRRSLSLHTLKCSRSMSSTSSSQSLHRRRSHILTGAITLGSTLLFIAVLAGISSASPPAAYGVVLATGLLLMLLTTILVGREVVQVITHRTRPTEVGSRDLMMSSPELVEKDESRGEMPSQINLLKSSRGPGWGEGDSWCVFCDCFVLYELDTLPNN